jgi:polyisoprenoid-binding protein YceI
MFCLQGFRTLPFIVDLESVETKVSKLKQKLKSASFYRAQKLPQIHLTRATFERLNEIPLTRPA